MDWLDLLAVQGTLKGLLQHHSSKASILQHLAFFISWLLMCARQYTKCFILIFCLITQNHLIWWMLFVRGGNWSLEMLSSSHYISPKVTELCSAFTYSRLLQKLINSTFVFCLSSKWLEQKWWEGRVLEWALKQPWGNLVGVCNRTVGLPVPSKRL